jgi:hypothetical protein
MIKRIWAPDGTAPDIGDDEVFVQFEVCEPLLLSPFVFGAGYGKQGFYGIQTMNFQMNMAPTANRAWRCAIQPTTPDYVKTAVVTEFKDSRLIFQFLTPHPSVLLAPRNTVPYYELPIYRTTNLGDITGRFSQCEWSIS